VRSLTEIRRVLKPGGRAVVDFPNKYCPWFEFLKFLMGGEWHIHDHTYSTGQEKRMMQQARFVNIRTHHIIVFCKGSTGGHTTHHKATDFLFERTPGLNYFAGIIVCKGEKLGA